MVAKRYRTPFRVQPLGIPRFRIQLLGKRVNSSDFSPYPRPNLDSSSDCFPPEIRTELHLCHRWKAEHGKRAPSPLIQPDHIGKLRPPMWSGYLDRSANTIPPAFLLTRVT